LPLIPIAALVGLALVGPLQATDQTSTGTASATAPSSTWLAFEVPFTGDADRDGWTVVELGLTPGGPFNLGTRKIPGPPDWRADSFRGLTPDTDYYLRVTWVDPDGVSGANPQVVGPIRTLASAPNAVTLGTATATVGDTEIAVSVPISADANANSYGTVAIATAPGGPWTERCGNPSAPRLPFHPKRCRLRSLTPGTDYWVRIDITDADGIAGADPQVLGPITYTGRRNVAVGRPISADPGWGCCPNPGQLLDRRIQYQNWYYGFAWRGGTSGWGGGPPGWKHATIDLGAPTTFDRVEVWLHDNNSPPTTWKVEASPDGASWTEVFSTTEPQCRGATEQPEGTSWGYPACSQQADFAPATARYVRYRFDDTTLFGGLHGWAAELEVFGIAAECIDNDGDGYGSPGDASCPGGPAEDCDDDDDSVHPGAAEALCDGIDQNCNGLADDDLNADGDPVSLCDGDCDDDDPTIYPGAAETLCDGIDQNCNGLADDDVNADGDPVSFCAGDCDDTDRLRFPGHPEVCDGLDNDCNEVVDGGGDALCTDGVACNGAEICAGVEGCQPAPPIDCSPLTDDCNIGVCTEPEGECIAEPRPAGTPCGDEFTCSDTGDPSGGGTCTVTVYRCQSGACRGHDIRNIDTCGDAADHPSVTWYRCSGDNATCVPLETRESDSCSYDGDGNGGGTCSATDWTCSGSPGRLSWSSSGGDDSCRDDGQTATLTTFSCETVDGVAADTCWQLGPREGRDTCSYDGGPNGGGSCSAQNHYCSDPRTLRRTVTGGADSCGDDGQRVTLIRQRCGTADGTPGPSGDNCLADSLESSDDTCSYDGGPDGGGTCAATNVSCADGSTRAEPVVTGGSDLCSDDGDRVSLTTFSCGTADGTQGPGGDACQQGAPETSDDSCTDGGDLLGGGSCSATNYSCADARTRAAPSSSSGVDTCGGDEDDPSVRFYSCAARDGAANDSCSSDWTARTDSCSDDGDLLGGGSCSATDWDCTGTPGRLASTSSSGTDTCGGDTDNPSVEYWSCGSDDGGVKDDSCEVDTTQRSDNCTDTGDELGGGRCSATDWDCADGLLSQTDSIGTDSCVDGTTTFYGCDASDGTSNDSCTSDTTLCSVLDETCADGLCDEGGSLCEAVNRDAGDPCRGGNDNDTACTEPDSCDGQGVCLPNNEECAFVTSSALCAFDVQPDKGMCTVTNEACAFDTGCAAAGGAVCADGVCQNEDGEPIDGAPACTEACGGIDDYCAQRGQFRLLFTPDVRSFPAYKLPASNPGQTFYNLLLDGAAGSTVPVSLSIPHPYVTKGGQPVHVYDGWSVVGACIDSSGATTGQPCSTSADCGAGETCDSSCFAPGAAEQQFDAQWTIDDWVDGVTGRGGVGWTLDCDSVCGPDGSGTCTLDLGVVIPDSNKAYVNVHLAYGLKGLSVDANPCDDALVDRYDQGGSSGTLFAEVGFHALVNNDTEDGPVGIADGTDYAFSHTDDTHSYDDAVQNLNAFKPIAGSFGRCTHENNGNPCNEGLLVELIRNNSGEVVKSGLTDQDGFWTTPYKHKGKPVLYTVVIYEPGCTLIGQEIELQGNGWANVDFDASTCTSTAEYGKGRNKRK
jgi:hypothetical protein